MKHNIFKSIIFIVTVLIILTGCREQNTTTEHETQQKSAMSTDVTEENESNDEETVYYGQSEISKDDIVFVPHVTVEIPEENTSEGATDQNFRYTVTSA